LGVPISGRAIQDSAFAAVPARLLGLVAHYRAELSLLPITHAV